MYCLARLREKNVTNTGHSYWYIAFKQCFISIQGFHDEKTHNEMTLLYIRNKFFMSRSHKNMAVYCSVRICLIVEQSRMNHCPLF